MLNGEFFTIEVPKVETSYADPVLSPVADGCSNNSNYYTDYGSRGTCCCNCDKAVVAM